MTKDKKIPLLWKVLGNNYKGKLEFGIHKDSDGKAYETLQVEKMAKVLIYPAGATKPTRYEGRHNISSFSIRDLTALA